LQGKKGLGRKKEMHKYKEWGEKKERVMCRSKRERQDSCKMEKKKKVPFSLHDMIRSSSLNLAGASTSFLPLSLLLQFS